MTDFNHHYKEITPQNTVQNVKNFFQSHGMRIEECDVTQAESGTWYCHVDVFMNDTRIGGANGKGMTYEYSLASGYAELYERFCNMFCRANHYVTNEIIKQNEADGKNYKLRSDEKIVNYDYLFNLPIVNRYVSAMAPNNPALQKTCIDYWTNGEYIGFPWIDIENSNNIMYLDPRVAVRITRSIGMVAGNTVSEALNQGLSELCERENELWLYFEKCKNYYSVNLDSIKSEALQEKIATIRNCGYDFYIFDFSYESGLPGVMSLLIDRKNGTLNVNFGSFPVFEIAVERVITELYQGIKSYKIDWYKARLQRPFKQFTANQIAQIYANSIAGDVFPAYFFDKIIEVPHCSNVYADPNSTNEKLNQYFRDLAKSKGIKFYYCDNSLTPEITALHLIMDNPNGKLYFDDEWDARPLVQKLDLTVIQTVHKMSQQILDGDTNPSNLLNLFKLFPNPNFDGKFLGLNMLWSNFAISAGSGNEFYHLQKLISNEPLDQVPDEILNTPVYLPLKRMATLLRYMRTGLYSREEIKHILNDLYHFNLTDEDFKNCGNANYMLKFVYFNPMVEYIHTDEFKQFCRTYIYK